MIKKTILVIINLILVFGIKAQEVRKNWSEGKLTWSDFIEKVSGKTTSHLQYIIGYNTEECMIHDTTIVRIGTFCYSNKLSWVNPDYKTDACLRYNQVIFDIAELSRRELQFSLDRENSRYLSDEVLQGITEKCAKQVEKFERETNSGQDLRAINEWEKLISDELNKNDIRGIPSFTRRNFGYGYNVGLGTSLFTGSLGQHFGPAISLVFGFEIAYKKTILFLNGTIGGSKVKHDYKADKNWYAGQAASLSILDISLGYALIDNTKLKLSPFGGLGITKFKGKNRDNAQDGLVNTYNSYIAGLNADYKIRKKVSLIPGGYKGKREFATTSLRIRVYLTRADYSPGLNGNSINMAIGFSGFGNLIRLIN